MGSAYQCEERRWSHVGQDGSNLQGSRREESEHETQRGSRENTSVSFLLQMSAEWKGSYFRSDDDQSRKRAAVLRSRVTERPLGTTYLSEEEVGVRAEPLLLLAALQQHHGLRRQAVFLLQPAAQSPAVLGEQSGGHPQGLVTQPVDGSERTGTQKMGRRTGRQGNWRTPRVKIRVDRGTGDGLPIASSLTLLCSARITRKRWDGAPERQPSKRVEHDFKNTFSSSDYSSKPFGVDRK
ncbi:hypothetical protein EYF80_027548 [Liparis tanakae]|uniref:Uncharacterized protein n=1 Tax=Liparis tanakae TaxID=230148 RepID=A0A4Z2H8F5_9TELE|nr:hypothetical protein EYF80_027548 [Liparis tanakae]